MVPLCVAVAPQPDALTPWSVTLIPGDSEYMVPRSVVYVLWSARYASWAVTRFLRSAFMDVRYARSFVLENFGMAMAARIPMITTTIRSSISVNPLDWLRMA
jgi:hypothetical protein